jgi:2'-5' RNA ligase
MPQKNPQSEITASLNTARVFFALWPSADLRQGLQRVAEAYALPCAARVMSAERLHLTLLYIGEVERARLTTLMQAGGAVSALPFWLVIDRLACWQHNQIAYATTQQPLWALDDLVAALKHAVEAAGFSLAAAEFHAHITLLRKVQYVIEPQNMQPLRWWVDSFVLVESVGVAAELCYQILALWPLVGRKLEA